MPILFFNDAATTEIYALSLHDALPIYKPELLPHVMVRVCDVMQERFPVANHRDAVRGVGLTMGAESLDVVPIVDEDRKSTRLNSSHANISYAVFCLKKKSC